MISRFRHTAGSLLSALALAACAPAAVPATQPAPAATPLPAPTKAPAATPLPAPTKAPEPTATPKPLKIVASTSWVGAFAKAAGATDITVIAPSTIQHPPDYDPKPADLVSVSKADFVLLAGFEGFAKRMQEAAGGDPRKVITVNTENSAPVIRSEVTRLGGLFGTQDKARAYLSEFDALYGKLAADLKTKAGGEKRVVVAQAFAVPWAQLAGLDPSGIYGPSPLGPGDLKKLVNLNPSLVFENTHMGGGQPVVESSGARKIELINFPGDDLDLLKVFNTNAQRIGEALGQPAAAQKLTAPDPFAVSLAQIRLDTAGFHDMATTLSNTRKIESLYLGRVTAAQKVLDLAPWPAPAATQAKAFSHALGDFAAALTAGNVDAAIKASAETHDAQHDLSKAVDAWLATKPAKAASASPFAISQAQALMDSAGFHEMAETLNSSKKINSAYLSPTRRARTLIAQTVWPAALEKQSVAFISSLDSLSAALTAGDVKGATESADRVHDQQHDLSRDIDTWLKASAQVADRLTHLPCAWGRRHWMGLASTAWRKPSAIPAKLTQAILHGSLRSKSCCTTLHGPRLWANKQRAF